MVSRITWTRNPAVCGRHGPAARNAAGQDRNRASAAAAGSRNAAGKHTARPQTPTAHSANRRLPTPLRNTRNPKAHPRPRAQQEARLEHCQRGAGAELVAPGRVWRPAWLACTSGAACRAPARHRTRGRKRREGTGTTGMGDTPAGPSPSFPVPHAPAPARTRALDWCLSVPRRPRTAPFRHFPTIPCPCPTLPAPIRTPYTRSDGLVFYPRPSTVAGFRARSATTTKCPSPTGRIPDVSRAPKGPPAGRAHPSGGRLVSAGRAHAIEAGGAGRVTARRAATEARPYTGRGRSAGRPNGRRRWSSPRVCGAASPPGGGRVGHGGGHGLRVLGPHLRQTRPNNPPCVCRLRVPSLCFVSHGGFSSWGIVGWPACWRDILMAV